MTNTLALFWYTNPDDGCRVWSQTGDEPAGDDHLVAVFTEAEVAEAAVKRWNSGQAGL